MSNRPLWREMALISLPLVFIGGLLGWGEWQKRFRTPTIALSVQLDKIWPPKAHVPTPIKGFGIRENEKMGFGWTAHLSGGPQSGYRFGWNERIIAKTPRGPIVVWKQNAPPKAWLTNAVSGSFATTDIKSTFSSSQGINLFIHAHRYAIDQTTLPVDTQTLEWRGEIAAIPSNDADLWQSPLSHEMLENWGQTQGAAKWQQTLTRPYNARRYGPVVLQKQEPIRGNDKTKTSVRVLSRPQNRRTFQSVVAFDGTKRRTLWTQTQGSTGLCHSSSNEIGYGGNKVLFSFDIRSIPIQWGQIIFLCDTVFDTNKRAPTLSFSDDRLDERALDAFERKTGGYRVSRRLILRPMPNSGRS